MIWEGYTPTRLILWLVRAARSMRAGAPALPVPGNAFLLADLCAEESC